MLLHIGALLDRAPGRKYTGALRYAELSLRQPLPKTSTLTSMRKSLPSEFVVGLRAPRNAVISPRGPLRETPELSEARTWLHDAATALQARAVIIHTPSELTPGARSKDLLREYFAQLPKVPERHYVWAAQGAWEPEEAQALCQELGILRAFDPLETASSPGSAVYATLRALGHRAGFSYSALSDAVAKTLEHHPSEAFIAVDAERSFDLAKRLQTLANEALGVGAASEVADADADEFEAGEEEDWDDDDESDGSDDEAS
jgi:uncharacterized protein YecE (DUF72 family)